MTSPPAPTLTQVPAPAGLLVLTPLPCKSTDNAGLALVGAQQENCWPDLKDAMLGLREAAGS